MSARDSIENLWDRATPVGPLLDAYRDEVLDKAADWLDGIGQHHAAVMLRPDPTEPQPGAPQCPEALYSPETDTLRRCTRGPHDWRDWHETEIGTQWRHATEEQNFLQLDDPFSKDPWTDVPAS